MNARTFLSLLAFASVGSGYAHDWSGAAGNFFLSTEKAPTAVAEDERVTANAWRSGLAQVKVTR